MITTVKKSGILFTILITMCTTTIYAQQNQNGRGPKQGNRHAISDLTADQQLKMDDLRFKMQKEMLPLKNELQEKNAKLNTLRTSDKPDLNAIYALIDEIGKIKTTMAKKREAHMQDIRLLLTDKQRVEFDLKHRKNNNMHKGGKGQCPNN